jgi:signal transduction histidine kinase
VNRALVARLLRLLLVASWTGAVFVVVVLALDGVVGEAQRVLLPFAAAGVAACGLVAAREPVDRFVRRVTHHRLTTPYSVLAQTTARVGAGSLEEALPGLAQVLAEGTGAQRAVVWLVVEGPLVEAAAYPPPDAGAPAVAENLGVLLARSDTHHVVPVLDGTVLRAALSVAKPDAPITPGDQRLMQDVADGAGLLLRSVQRGAELQERVRQADELAAERRESGQRLTRAREVERRRLIGELGHATTGRLTALRGELAGAAVDLDALPARPEPALEALGRARVALDELLDRFRVIARGVYPAVLRDQGPYGALDELATDLPRPVRLTGNLPARLAWEVESGIYYLAASAMQQLAGQAGERALRVHLTHADARLAVEIDDPTPSTSIAELRNGLAHDAERLAALGGDLEVSEDDAGGARLRAWLPEQLEPYVDRFSSVGTRPGAP